MELMFSTPMEAALAFAACGLSVIPLRSRDKCPAIPWKQYTQRRATDDEIRGWYDQHPDWNVGIVCGAVSGIAVVDIDGEEGERWFIEHGLEKSCLWQRTSGPHKCHMIFRHPGPDHVVHPSVDTTVKVDVRGDGSQIVAAPSIHPSGAVYRMVTTMGSLEEALAALPLMPGMFVSDSEAIAPQKKSVPAPSLSENVVEEGGRNSTLTSMCGSWYARGLTTEEVFALAHSWNAAHCSPMLDDREVETIVTSMAGTHAENNPGLLNTSGVRGWVDQATGEFSVSDIYRDMSIRLASDKAKVRATLDRLISSGVIEQAGNRDGVYRKRDDSLQMIDVLADDEGEEIDMWLPFGLSRSTYVYSGNVILVAGETNSGKTSLLLNIVAHNWQHRFRYLSSEMTTRELRNRLLGFNIDLSEWTRHCEFVQRSSNFHDAIDPDAINVIDYLEVTDEFYRTGKYITQIFERLRKGIAIICLQKKKGEMFGRGGEFGLEKPRLGISLFSHGHLPNGVFGSCVVTKAKNIKGNNPQGKEIFYRLKNGVDYDTKCLEACPTIRDGFAFYNARDRKQVMAEIENYCLASQVSDDEIRESAEIRTAGVLK